MCRISATHLSAASNSQKLGNPASRTTTIAGIYDKIDTLPREDKAAHDRIGAIGCEPRVFVFGFAFFDHLDPFDASNREDQKVTNKILFKSVFILFRYAASMRHRLICKKSF
jgi:hypothetical protein